MVMRINQLELHRNLQDRAGAFGGSPHTSHTPQISTSLPEQNVESNRYAIHLFEDQSSNSIRLIELDDTLLTGRLDDDIEILGLYG